MINGIALATGVFFGNLLLVPLITDRSFKDSFAIGVIAGLIVLAGYAFVL